MAENKRPLFAVDEPPRHIDLATINKRRSNSKPTASNNPTAMDLDRLSVMVDTTRMQLISPPPEEMLRVIVFIHSVLPRSDHVCAANFRSEEEKDSAYSYLFFHALVFKGCELDRL